MASIQTIIPSPIFVCFPQDRWQDKSCAFAISLSSNTRYIAGLNLLEGLHGLHVPLWLLKWMCSGTIAILSFGFLHIDEIMLVIFAFRKFITLYFKKLYQPRWHCK